MTTTEGTSSTRDTPGAALAPAHVGDLDTRCAIHDLVVAFYREIVFDELLAPVFGEVAETDWNVHIPRLIDYWCRILLDERGYQLWVASIDARWCGTRAERAKAHAAATAGLISRRLRGIDHDCRTGPAEPRVAR